MDAACAWKAGFVILALKGMSTSLDREIQLNGEVFGGRSGLKNIGECGAVSLSDGYKHFWVT